MHTRAHYTSLCVFQNPSPPVVVVAGAAAAGFHRHALVRAAHSRFPKHQNIIKVPGHVCQTLCAAGRRQQQQQHARVRTSVRAYNVTLMHTDRVVAARAHSRIYILTRSHK